MIFKKLEINDLNIFSSYIQSTELKMCEYSPFTLYMWRDFYDLEYAVMGDALFLRYPKLIKGQDAYSWPLFKERVQPSQQLQAVRQLKEVLYKEKANDIAIKIVSVPSEAIEFLREEYAEKGLSEYTNRDWYEYIYDFDEIEQLAGRKFSSKRNHIKNFDRNYPNSRLELIDKTNIQDVIAFYNRQLEQELPIVLESGSVQGGEELETKEMLEKLLQLESEAESVRIEGAVLYVGERVAGFTIGAITENTLMIHIEKADIEFKGVYAKLFHEFVLQYSGRGLKYINREDDVGEEGLRRSKLSYHPVALIEKYTVTL